MNIVELLEDELYVNKPLMCKHILDSDSDVDETVEQYLHMLMELHKIDPEASQWILDNELTPEYDMEYSYMLVGVFVWDTTPQGYAYWSDLHQTLLGSGAYDNFKQSKPKSAFNEIKIEMYLSIGFVGGKHTKTAYLHEYFTDYNWEALTDEEKEQELDEILKEWSSNYIDRNITLVGE